MIERHQDYVLRNITVSPNGTANFVVQMDTDAPFALRTVATSNMPYQGFQFTITGMDDRLYAAGTPETAVDSLLNPAAFFIVYPQIPFATQITLQVAITDLSGDGISDGVMVFRGCKIYPPGTVFGPQYPATYSELNFRYTYPFTLAAGTSNAPTVLASQPLDIQADADFVVRMLSGFVQPLADGFSVGGNDVILRDQYGKPYSTDSGGGPGWVPMETLFPIPNGDDVSVAQWWSVPDVTIYPEIYIPKSQQLLIDIRRTNGTQNNTYNLTLHGSKIFQG
jgi:hypothetical protein